MDNRAGLERAACAREAAGPERQQRQHHPRLIPTHGPGGASMADRISVVRLRLALLIAGVLTSFGLALSSAQPMPPTPQSVIGFEPCADYHLATYEQIAEYFRTLAAAASDRIHLLEMGKTAEGRTQLMAIISSGENLRQLARFKDIAAKLAMGRDGGRPLTDSEARALARAGKA